MSELPDGVQPAEPPQPRDAALGIVLSLGAVSGAAAEDAVTTADPSIPTEELDLLLVPLSKAELLTEAAGWQEIVKRKAQEIARAEIAVLRENREIAQAQDVKDSVEAAREQLEPVQGLSGNE